MTDKRKAYEEKYDAQLREWSAEIVLLNADKAYPLRQRATRPQQLFFYWRYKNDE